MFFFLSHTLPDDMQRGSNLRSWSYSSRFSCGYGNEFKEGAAENRSPNKDEMPNLLEYTGTLLGWGKKKCFRLQMFIKAHLHFNSNNEHESATSAG